MYARFRILILVFPLAACAGGTSQSSSSSSGDGADGGAQDLLPSGAVGESGVCTELAPSTSAPIRVRSLPRRDFVLGSVRENGKWNSSKIVVSGTAGVTVGGPTWPLMQIHAEGPAQFVQLGALTKGTEASYYLTENLEAWERDLTPGPKTLVDNAVYSGRLGSNALVTTTVKRTAAAAGLPQPSEYLASIYAIHFTGVRIFYDLPNDCVSDQLKVLSPTAPLDFLSTGRKLTEVERLLRQGGTKMRIEVVTTLREGALDEWATGSTCATGKLQGCIDLIAALDARWQSLQARFASAEKTKFVASDDADLLTVPGLEQTVPAAAP